MCIRDSSNTSIGFGIESTQLTAAHSRYTILYFKDNGIESFVADDFPSKPIDTDRVIKCEIPCHFGEVSGDITINAPEGSAVRFNHTGTANDTLRIKLAGGIQESEVTNIASTGTIEFVIADKTVILPETTLTDGYNVIVQTLSLIHI